MTDITRIPPSPTREQASRRTRPRLQLPLMVTIDGDEHAALDWSAGGFGLATAADGWRAGALVQAALRFALQDSHWGFTTLAQIRHIATAGRAGFRFVDLQPGQIAALDVLVRASITGEIVTIERLLAVDQANPPPQIPAPPPAKMRRFIGYTLLLAAGCGLATAVALSLHARFLVVHAAHVAATVPVVRISAPIAGTLRDLRLTPGMAATDGQPLFGFDDEALQTDIELAEAELRWQTARLESLRRRQAKLAAFFGEYAHLAQAEVDRGQAGMAQAEEGLRLAKRDLARVEDLAASGNVAEARIDQTLQKYSLAQRAVLTARSDLDQAQANLKMARDGHYFTGTRIEDGDPAALAQEVRQAQAVHALQSRKLAALLDRRSRMVITSPCDCLVAQVLARDGEWVEAGTKIYLLRPRGITPELLAKVPQAEARRLTVGAPAQVRLADRQDVVAGTIAAVNRLPPAEARLGMAATTDTDPALATVSIRIEPAIARQLAPGTPAQAAFPIDARAAFFDWLQ